MERGVNNKQDKKREQTRIRVQRYRAKQKRLYVSKIDKVIRGLDMSGIMRLLDNEILRTHGDIDMHQEIRALKNLRLGTVIEGESYIKKWIDQNGRSSNVPQEIIKKERRAIRKELNKIKKR